jgi:hypothetical protein
MRKYQYGELSPAAQTEVYETYVDIIMQYEDLSHITEQFQEYLLPLGIITTPKDYAYSGFYSQGDGASFTASLNLRTFLEMHPAIRNKHQTLYLSNVPFDQASPEYAEYYDVYLTRNQGRYCHENTVRLGNYHVLCHIDRREYFERLFEEATPDIEDQCRSYMRQLYLELENCHENHTSMEVFLEESKGREYNKDGSCIS